MVGNPTAKSIINRDILSIENLVVDGNQRSSVIAGFDAIMVIIMLSPKISLSTEDHYSRKQAGKYINNFSSYCLNLLRCSQTWFLT